MKNVVLLDLEMTLIRSWDDPQLLLSNIEKIKQLIPKNARLGLFSWAIYDDRDLERFEKQLQPVIEEHLGICFDDGLLWSMDDICQQLAWYGRKVLTREDLFDCFGKAEILFLLTRCHPSFTGCQVSLIDDTVEHGLIWHSLQNGCTAQLINIDRI